MPLLITKQIRVTEISPTMVSLQMVDKSIKYPLGIVEDVLVKVGELISLVDFLIQDIKASLTTYIILGKPLLSTKRALIDVGKGNLTLRGFGGDQITFKVFGVKR